jgi:hypothetical protein
MKIGLNSLVILKAVDKGLPLQIQPKSTDENGDFC